MTGPDAAANIEALIARIREEGVAEGRAEADRIVAEAETRARAILAKAEADAAREREAARQDADRDRRAGEEALRVAVRDAVLRMKQELTTRFAGRIAESVSAAMRDDAVLERMILEVAGRARAEARVDAASEVEVVLPREVVGIDDLIRHPEALREGPLSRLVLESAGELLREGVTFSRAEDGAGGVRVILKPEGIIVDLSDRAVADVILRHLQPRFRALLEGVVR